jgi:hypothetical protein
MALVRARSWGRVGRSCAGCGRARSPGSIGLCLTGPSVGPSPRVMNNDVLYIYTNAIHHPD